jgi:hypothetical protein
VIKIEGCYCLSLRVGHCLTPFCIARGSAPGYLETVSHRQPNFRVSYAITSNRTIRHTLITPFVSVTVQDRDTITELPNNPIGATQTDALRDESG